jgi:NADH pyrophosphatase NudC (nudix superfamily)
MSSKLREVLEKFSEIDLSGLKFPLDGDSSTIYNSDKKEITIPYWRGAELLNEVKAAQDMAKSALTEQKHEAKWELGAEYEYAYCSHCRHQQWASWDSHREAVENIGEFHKEYKFCPNCGFEMKG